MKYEKIIILGTGRLFLDCLSYVNGLGIPYEGYDMSASPSKITQAQAKKKGLNCSFVDKNILFPQISREWKRTLLLSVINPAIIPGEILEKENILALNCHQALLPRHKGRNAESWAIYDGDDTTGITWHRMTARVDAGEILAQKEVPITETTTACQLFRQQLKAAYEAFTEFMPEVLNGRETYRPQDRTETGDFHYSWEMPAQGRFDPGWSPEKISRFLRATDYGILDVMKRPGICVKEQEYTFQSYKIEKTETPEGDGVRFSEDCIIVCRKNYKFTLWKWEAVRKNAG